MSDEPDVLCAVCEQKLGKSRCHYGGLSCYSCRAFFRRNTQRQETPVCKADGDCPVNTSVRKQCAACRYQKCLSIGMRPELVLDDDEKKTRFRKFYSKKAETLVNTTSVSGQPQPVRRRGQKKSGNAVTNIELANPEMTPYVEVKTEVDFGPVAEGYPQQCEETYPVYQDRRSQQELLWLRLGSQEPVPEAAGEHFVKQEVVEQEHTNYRSVISNNASKLEILADIAPEELRHFLGSAPGPSTSSVIYNPVTTNCNNSVIRGREEQIVNTVNIAPTPQQQAEQGGRKSVIVRAGPKVEILDDKDDDISIVINNAMSLLPDTKDILDTLPQEENFEHVNQEISKILNIVTFRWCETSYGSQALQEYIGFCRHRSQFPHSFYNSNVIRDRCKKILNSLSELLTVSQEEKKSLLSHNLAKAEMFSLCHAFNKPTWEEELNFLFGNEDKMMWMSCTPPVTGIPISTMITRSPLSELNKLELYRMLTTCKSPDGLLADTVVFTFSLLLILLSPTPASSWTVSYQVKSAHNKYETMLVKYLRQQRGQDIDADMKTIYACMETLQKLSNIFETLRN